MFERCHLALKLKQNGFWFLTSREEAKIWKQYASGFYFHSTLPFELLSPKFWATKRCSRIYIISPPRFRYSKGNIRFAILHEFIVLLYFFSIYNTLHNIVEMKFICLPKRKSLVLIILYFDYIQCFLVCILMDAIFDIYILNKVVILFFFTSGLTRESYGRLSSILIHSSIIWHSKSFCIHA